MKTTSWGEQPAIAELKFENAPYTTLGEANWEGHMKTGTYAVLALSSKIELTEKNDATSIFKFSGTVVTQYSTMSPIIRVGVPKGGGRTTAILYVPVFDIEIWTKLANPRKGITINVAELLNKAQNAGCLQQFTRD